MDCGDFDEFFVQNFVFAFGRLWAVLALPIVLVLSVFYESDAYVLCFNTVVKMSL